MSLGYVFLIVYLISTIPHLTIFRDRVQALSANISQVSSSVILKRIEKLSDNFHGRNNHNSHCQFDRDGGGHGNICWADKIKEDLTENYHKKDREISI